MMTPDFFIVGAPKCGTTSLATWLGQHPAFFMSPPPFKEPDYFATDVPWRRPANSEGVYARLFNGAETHQACGEASTSYLFSDIAVPAIVQANPRANFIAMVRNPIDMVVSLHAQKVYNHKEPARDFAEAWSWSPKRNRWLDYRQLGLLGEQIKRIQSWVPRGQLHVVVFDDLVANPASVYRDACIFLGNLPDERTEFAATNPRKERRWDFIERMIRHPPPPFGWLKQKALDVAPMATKRVRKRINTVNSRRIQSKPLSDALRQELVDHFREDIDMLGRLLGRDLAHWYGGGE